MEQVNCELMSRDIVVARWENQQMTVVRPDLLPLFFARVNSVEEWLKTRAIDSSRTNSRLIKRALRLSDRNDLTTVWHVHGATVTDTYWVREIGSDTKYNDIRFSTNDFADLALRGVGFADAGDSPHRHTPELTNTGSFEKCWRREDGQWYLVKQATEREAFSEIFVSKLCDQLGIPVAVYEKDAYGVRTPDFTHNATVNFEPASSFIRENDSGDYERMYQATVELCPSAGLSFVQMLFVDAICHNVDRHLGNFGLLRDPGTGEILGMAPLFDHNLALISRDDPTVGRDDMLLRDFRDFLNAHPEYQSALPTITPETVERAMDGLACPVDRKYIVALVVSRYEKAIERISIGKESFSMFDDER